MRFTLIEKEPAPSFSHISRRSRFVVLAVAEVTVCAVLVTSFWRLMRHFDPPLLASGFLLILAAATLLLRRSQAWAQAIFFIALLALQAMLLLEPPVPSISLIFVDLPAANWVWLALVFDLLILWMLLRKGVGNLADEAFEAPAPSVPAKKKARVRI